MPDSLFFLLNCGSCHNGTSATGKHSNHIRSTSQCEDCHKTNAWSPVKRVDHASVVGQCSSCHNGTDATGKHPGHLTSGDTCDDCSNGTFDPASDGADNDGDGRADFDPVTYASPGNNGGDFDIYTLGRDGTEGGEGIDTDIGNWNVDSLEL